MDEFGGLDIGMPGEGEGGVSEGLSEDARQRFAQASAALQQIQKEEKKAKKRDDRVAQVILQFLTDSQRTHLAALISRLVSLNCPSTFILSILSLISDPCKTAVDDYLREHADSNETVFDASLVAQEATQDLSSDEALTEWIGRMERVLATDSQTVVDALLVDGGNIDGSILQLTTFVMQEFLQTHGKNAQYEDLQKPAVNVLQSLFEPYMRVQESLDEENPA